MSDWTQTHFSEFSRSGVVGQFGVGLLLGAVWSPCVGPTLGAASMMAARGESLGIVTLTMLAFGIGSVLPLLVLAGLSREVLMQWRRQMLHAATALKMALGVLLTMAGMATLTGVDRSVQTVLQNSVPDWVTNLTTRF
jgi:cytochrome c biogenesis protein CcdA